MRISSTYSALNFLSQLKMEPIASSLIHHSIDIHLVALPKTYMRYTFIYTMFPTFLAECIYIYVAGTKGNFIDKHDSSH